MTDEARLHDSLRRRVHLVRPVSEGLAVAGGCLSSLVFFAVVAGLVEGYLVMRNGTPFDGRRCGLIAAAGVLVACFLAWAQGGSLRRSTLDRTLDAAGSVLSPFTRYQGNEVMAGGCLVALIQFLGGSVMASVAWFLRRPLLNARQAGLAAGLVRACLDEPGLGIDKLHDLLLPAWPDLTENDFERVLRVLRHLALIEGQSYLSVSPAWQAELEEGPR
ncbi:MAG TPA: hypothetical protein VGO93_23630 [Candidatus Xenobia bacterium]|jgi:hypothetical protein